MIKKYAMVRNRKVENIVIWDGSSSWNPGDSYEIVELSNGQYLDIGWNYDGSNFSEPSSIPDQE